MNQTIVKLQELYNTSKLYYLSDFYKPGGDKRLYEFLTSVYCPEYNNNFRIIILQDCVDVYDYQDMPGNAVTALQKYASQIDISNFFIVIVTNNENINTELEQARRLYSSDDVPMQSEIIKDSEYTITTQDKQDTFCVLPWMHLYVGPDGNILPCCVSDQLHPMGNILTTPVDDIVAGEKFNQLRRNMLDGKKSKECSSCYRKEASHQASMRQHANHRWQHQTNEIISQHQFNGTSKTFNPTYLDIRLNNICNLKCRMCSGYFSSAIAQEEVSLFGSSKYSESTIRNKQRQQAFNDIFEYIPNAEKIYFAGGEPLIAAEHYKILELLIKYNNTAVELTYNTNFTTTTFRGQSVFDIWNHFKNVTVGASIDACGAVAEYVRHGTIWHNIEKNIIDIKQKCPHINLSITSTVGFLNVSSLIELQQSWINRKVLAPCEFTMAALITPEHLSLQALPIHHKTRLQNLIINHIDWCNNNNSAMLAVQWQQLIDYMMLRDCSFQLPEFVRLTKLLDSSRGESFAQIFPEYQDLITV